MSDVSDIDLGLDEMYALDGGGQLGSEGMAVSQKFKQPGELFGRTLSGHIEPTPEERRVFSSSDEGALQGDDFQAQESDHDLAETARMGHQVPVVFKGGSRSKAP